MSQILVLSTSLGCFCACWAICFIAHNGFNFDYPILRREIDRTKSLLPDDILCIDSLVVFKDLHSEDVRNIIEKDEVDIGAGELPLKSTEQYDELLFNEPGKFDTKYTDKVAIVQKMNETTPKKQKIITNPETSDFSLKFQYQPAKKIKLTQPTSAKKILKFEVYDRPTYLSENRDLPRSGSIVSFKLQDVYSRLTNKSPENVHQAEGDVFMLIMSAAIMGDRFVDWANSNAKKFCDIPPMLPGRKIGT